MSGFVLSLMLCAMAGSVLAILFLSPAGALAGAVNGVFVGLFVGWGKLRAGRRQSTGGFPG
jgi:hypothetical protein